jgi:hypothetical protein
MPNSATEHDAESQFRPLVLQYKSHVAKTKLLQRTRPWVPILSNYHLFVFFHILTYSLLIIVFHLIRCSWHRIVVYPTAEIQISQNSPGNMLATVYAHSLSFCIRSPRDDTWHTCSHRWHGPVATQWLLNCSFLPFYLSSSAKLSQHYFYSSICRCLYFLYFLTLFSLHATNSNLSLPHLMKCHSTAVHFINRNNSTITSQCWMHQYIRAL